MIAMNEKKKAQYNDDFILLTYIALLRCAFFEVRHVLWGVHFSPLFGV